VIVLIEQSANKFAFNLIPNYFQIEILFTAKNGD
jgi:hypothetical protein